MFKFNPCSKLGPSFGIAEERQVNLVEGRKIESGSWKKTGVASRCC